MTPLLSIIIPVYQAEDYVQDCLLSIMDPDVNPECYEVIVVNDGTPDGSMRIVSSMAEGKKNICIVNQENQGAAVARMTGLAKASGEYVWFVDSDDYLMDGAIKTMLEAITSFHNIDLFVVPVYWKHDNPERNHTDYCPPQAIQGTGKDLLRTKQLPTWMPVPFIIRRSLFNSPYLFFPEVRIHEDVYFGLALAYIAPSVMIMDRAQYVYRIHENSIMTSRSIRSSYTMLEIYQLLKPFYQKVVDDSDKPWFKEEMVRVLLDCYRINRSLFSSPEFSEFKKKKLNYILREYWPLRSARSLPRVVLDLFLLLAPRFYSALSLK